MSQTVLITGASRGIGLELTRLYLDRGDRVIATCRNPDGASGLQAIKMDTLSIEQLDVTSADSISSLANRLKGRSIDVLINNAGIFGGRPQELEECDREEWINILQTNTIAPAEVTRALMPNIDAGFAKKIVLMSSEMGSIQNNSMGKFYMYRSSKAALNAIGRSMAIDFERKNISVAVMHPGWVQTDMGGANAPTTVADSVLGIAEVIDGLSIANSGRFMNFRNEELPW